MEMRWIADSQQLGVRPLLEGGWACRSLGPATTRLSDGLDRKNVTVPYRTGTWWLGDKQSLLEIWTGSQFKGEYSTLLEKQVVCVEWKTYEGWPLPAKGHWCLHRLSLPVYLWKTRSIKPNKDKAQLNAKSVTWKVVKHYQMSVPRIWSILLFPPEKKKRKKKIESRTSLN